MSTWTRSTRPWSSATTRDLRGQPVIVGGTSNRGVVAAASYEVRKFGVRSAMPIREALRRCPHAICVKPRMSVYREVSHQVFAIFHEYTPIVEGLSLDEAFLDVTASLALKGDAVSIARGIKERIRADDAARRHRSASRLTSWWRRSPRNWRSPTGSPWSHDGNLRALLDPLERAPPARSRPQAGRACRGGRHRHARCTA